MREAGAPAARAPGRAWRRRLARGARAVAVGSCALLLGMAGLRFTGGEAGWVASGVNAAHSLGLSPYRAVVFQREETLPYAARTVPDPALPAGLHEVASPGANGTVRLSGVTLYRVPVAAPAAAARASASGGRRAPAGALPPRVQPAPAAEDVLNRQVIARPRAAVIVVGTAPAYVMANGRYYHYARALQMTATAYDDTAASNGPWTGDASAIGLPLNYGIVAVDPSIIPLGTRLYVQQYGLAIAADTGSAIIGERIDLFFWDTPHQIAAFGIRHLMVYVLDDPRLPPVPVSPALRGAIG